MLRHARTGGVLKVVLIVLALLAAIGIALGVWIAMSWRGWAATGMRNSVSTMLQQSQLPQEQRAVVSQRVDALAKEFEQMTSIAEEISQGPLMQAGVAWATHERFIAVSLLNDVEKADASLHLQRMARGMVEGTIPASVIDEVLAPIGTRDARGQWQPKGNASLEETKALVARVKAKADEAKIPVEPFTVDIAAELDKAIAAAKARTTR
jgi:hypothetical protein